MCFFQKDYLFLFFYTVPLPDHVNFISFCSPLHTADLVSQTDPNAKTTNGTDRKSRTFCVRPHAYGIRTTAVRSSSSSSFFLYPYIGYTTLTRSFPPFSNDRRHFQLSSLLGPRLFQVSLRLSPWSPNRFPFLYVPCPIFLLSFP